MRLRLLLEQVLLNSVEAGWVNAYSYAYVSFMNCDLLSVDAILDHLAEQVEAHGILKTSDLEFANEMWRQIRQIQRQPKRKGFFQRIFK